MWPCSKPGDLTLYAYIYSSGINQWATFSHTLIVLFYLRLTDMEQAWKPSRVEPDSSQQDQYRPLYGHYRAMLVRDLQRLNTMYEGNRPIEIRLHHNSSDSFRLDPSGMRCACTCSHVTINCPPIAWQMKSPSITFLWTSASWTPPSVSSTFVTDKV